MSDEVHVIGFNKEALYLEMKFDGDDYETATVKFSLKRKDYAPSLEEDVTIPVKCIFSLGYLMLMSIRRTGAQYELEEQEMRDRINQNKHPLGDKNGKEDKEK